MKRIERYNVFNDIRKSAPDYIQKIEKTVASEYFKKLYGFQIFSLDELKFEYFYGDRIYREKTVQQGKFLHKKHYIESGVKIIYYSQDNGYISCRLFPAKSEDMSQNEDSIFLYRRLSPEKLTEKLLEKHFRYFLSYMNVTSLDGSPTLVDKTKIFWIRLIKPTIINGKYHSPKIALFFFEIIKFSLTVGLSGFILLLLRYF